MAEGSQFWGLTPGVVSWPEPTAAEGCSPPAHTDLHLVVPHTSELSPAGLTPAHHREDLAKAVMFFLTDI